MIDQENKENDNYQKKININIETIPLVIIEFIRFAMLFVSLYAAFLCFKRNNGLSWCIIPAILFSPIYIVYVYATKPKNFKMNPFK